MTPKCAVERVISSELWTLPRVADGAKSDTCHFLAQSAERSGDLLDRVRLAGKLLDSPD